MDFHGSKLSAAIRASIENNDWKRALEPRDVRYVIDSLLQSLEELGAEVATLLRQTQPVCRLPSSLSTMPHDSYGVRRKSVVDRTSLQPLRTNFNMLFHQRFQVKSLIEFNTESVMTAVLKLALKTKIELLRLVVMNTQGYQQIQVNLIIMLN